MSSKQNKEIARRFVEEGWNNQNLEIVDELYAAEYIGHWYLPGGSDADRKTLKGFMRDVIEGFPDFQMKIEFIHADDAHVTFGFTSEGTHENEFMGIPPGKRTTFERPIPGHVTFRIEDGKIVEGWSTWDALGLLQELEVIPKDLRETTLAADD